MGPFTGVAAVVGNFLWKHNRKMENIYNVKSFYCFPGFFLPYFMFIVMFSVFIIKLYNFCEEHCSSRWLIYSWNTYYVVLLLPRTGIPLLLLIFHYGYFFNFIMYEHFFFHPTTNPLLYWHHWNVIMKRDLWFALWCHCFNSQSEKSSAIFLATPWCRFMA